MRPARSRHARAVLAACAAVGLVATVAPVVAAQEDDEPTTVEEAQQRFDELYAEAEKARVRLDEAVQERDALQARLEVATTALEREQSRLAAMTAELGGFAAAMYRSPVSEPTVELLVSEDAVAALDQSTRLQVVTEQRVQALGRVADAREALQRDRDDLAEQESRLATLEDEIGTEEARLRDAADRAEALLERLEEEERQRLAALRAQARSDADDRAARSQARAPAATSGGSAGVSGSRPAVGSGCVVRDPTGTGGCVTGTMAWVYDRLTATFGSTPTYCWRAGGGDHAQGRACDIMMAPGGTYPGPEATARGWAIAEWLRANAAALDVDYVIWQGRIWLREMSAQGWRPYNGYGATGGHYDHVHVSVRS